MKLVLGIIFTFSIALLGLGAPSIKIQLPSNPTVTEQKAGELLKHYLNKSVQNTFTVNGEKDVTFYIGNSDFAIKKGIKTDKMADESWMIKSFDNNVVLVGGGSRGTLYAVSHFVTDILKVWSFGPDEEYVPVYKQVFNVKKLNLEGKPFFAMRTIFPDVDLPPNNGHFAWLNRLNSYGQNKIPVTYGGSVNYGSPYFVHTFNWYFPGKKYFKNHPEYFALLNGKRVAGPGSQLCLTNEDVIQTTIAKLKQYILDDEAEARKLGIPVPIVYSISANDNNRICTCTKCNQVIQKERADSGLIIYFVNRVATSIKKFRPNVLISTLAYMNTELPPKRSKPLDNVIIRLCNTTADNIKDINAKEGKIFRDKVNAWSKVTDKIYIWQYGITYNILSLPYPSEFNYKALFNYYKKYKVKYIFIEHEMQAEADMIELKTYLEAKFMEDPKLDFKELFRNFMTKYYGQAAPKLTTYRKLLLKSANTHNSIALGYGSHMTNFTFLDSNTIIKSQKLFDEAEKLVADNEILLRRVKRARLNLDFATIAMFRKISMEWIASGKKLADFPLNQKNIFTRMEEEWVKSLKQSYVKKNYRDNKRLGRKFNKLNAWLRIFKHLPATSRKPEKFEKANVKYIDMLPELSRNFGNHKIVLDLSSETGYAIKIDADQEKKYQKLPILMGDYIVSTKGSSYRGNIKRSDIKGPGYNYYKTPKFRPYPSAYSFFLNDWTLQFSQDRAVAKNDGKMYEMWIRMKFTGPAFPFGKKEDKNAIYVDRVIMAVADSVR